MPHNNLLEKNNRRTGMTVPEGYFDDFAARMAASLPVQPWEKAAPAAPPRRSTWQILRPYVYLAAMFVGVWLMMQMFRNLSPESNGLNIDNNPVVTAALSNDAFVNEYFIDDMNQGDVYEELYEQGTTPEELQDAVDADITTE